MTLSSPHLEQHVLWFDVAVDELHGVQVLNGLCHFNQYLQGRGVHGMLNDGNQWIDANRVMSFSTSILAGKRGALDVGIGVGI